jgi:glycosyltransferase involved in cell wall biosynthesis
MPSAMTCALSVIICTHNPRADYFAKALAGLRAQEPLAVGQRWELLIIDNASDPSLASQIDLSWHPDARIVQEPRLGLTFARLRGCEEARNAILVFVDDDNILAPDYLRRAVERFMPTGAVSIWPSAAIRPALRSVLAWV